MKPQTDIFVKAPFGPSSFAGLNARLPDAELAGRLSEPLCKFGPGGDFVAVWPVRAGPVAPAPGGLRLLAAIVEAAAVILGLRRIGALQCSSTRFGTGSMSVERGTGFQPVETVTARMAMPPSSIQKEKQNHAVEHSRAFRAPDPSPAPASKDGRRLPGEPMLFPDVRRNGLRIEHKPKHRIRAYSRAAKKGASVRLSKQSTLFDAQFKSARIA